MEEKHCSQRATAVRDYVDRVSRRAIVRKHADVSIIHIPLHSILYRIMYSG
jgi:hypothetical protein